ncbi:MAG: hypothetical protein GXX82_15405 [Syntrophorhabdus sp.]|jgi:hypothetical protein|nr:hypothetical protein [Syntrophorhabdus sp.]
MKRTPLNKNQTRNARYILERAQQAGLSKDDAYTAAWFAFAESSLGEKLRGQGTIGGMYQYSQGAWDTRAGTYRYDPKEPDRNLEFKGFPWKTNKNQTGAQVTVLLADLERYKKEFDRLLDGADPGTVFRKDTQGRIAWERFIDPANGVPFTFEDYAYLRHNTSIDQTKRVNGLRTGDPDGAYEAIRNETDIVFNPGYQPGPYGAGSKDISDAMEDTPDMVGLLSSAVAADDDEDQCFGPSPGM